MIRTDSLVDAALRCEMQSLLMDGHLDPTVHFTLQQLAAKAAVLPHIDNLTPAEVAWVGMLAAKRAAAQAAGLLP